MLRESVKSVLALVVVIGFVVGLISWSADRPDGETWAYRVAGPAVAAAALAALLAVHFKRDRAPDLLRGVAGQYFDRAGFCFALSTDVREGRFVLQVHFQNQFERPCLGRVALRPAVGFFLGRAKIESVGCDVECGPGAFGVATLPLAVAAAAQGTRQKFEVGAAVEYPAGRGRRLRFGEGVPLSHNSRFSGPFNTALTLAGAAAGMIVLSHPASAMLDLPAGVEEELDAPPAPRVETLWRLGDPPLGSIRHCDPSGGGSVTAG